MALTTAAPAHMSRRAVRAGMCVGVVCTLALLAGCAVSPGTPVAADPVRTAARPQQVSASVQTSEQTPVALPGARTAAPAADPSGLVHHEGLSPAAVPADAEPASVSGAAGPVPSAAGDAGDADPIDRGRASWYGGRFHGRRTANGERYDMHAMTAAHKTLPFGTVVRVKSMITGREVQVRINDRGPFVRGRIIDLSRAAAQALGLLSLGHKEVELLWAGGVDLSTARAAVRGAAPWGSPTR